MGFFFRKKKNEEKELERQVKAVREVADALEKHVDAFSNYEPEKGEFDKYFNSLDATLRLLQNYRKSVDMSKLDVSVLDRKINYWLNFFVHDKMDGAVSKEKMVAFLEAYAENRGNASKYHDMNELIERVKASYVLMSSDEYNEKNDVNHRVEVRCLKGDYQRCLAPLYEFNVIAGKTTEKSLAELEKELPEKVLNEKRLNFVREVSKKHSKDKFLALFKEVLEEDIFSDAEIKSHILAAERDYEKVQNEKYENVVLFGIFTELVELKGKGVSEDKFNVFLRKRLAQLADNKVVYKPKEYKEYEAKYDDYERKNSRKLEEALKMTRKFYDAYLAESKVKDSGFVNGEKRAGKAQWLIDYEKHLADDKKVENLLKGYDSFIKDNEDFLSSARRK